MTCSRQKRLTLTICSLFLTGSLQAQYQWSCHYPNMGYPPYDGRAWEGYHSVEYVAYIPADHITGPTNCTFIAPPLNIPKQYKGDPNAILYGYPPQSWRVSSFYSFSMSGYRGPFLKDPGETRSYGAYSPLVGSTLSAADEDGVCDDCYLWHQKGFADNSSWSYDLSTPYATQGQVHYVGTGTNPLELPVARIAWDMRTVVDISNLDRITALVNYNHTCFPAHAILVNDLVVYNYSPGRADEGYIFNCLVLQLDKVVGQQQAATQVRCN